MQSVVNFEKPLPHLTLAQWNARLDNLKSTADKRGRDAYHLRHGARELMNETAVKTLWDTYHNNDRLKDRVYQTEQWKSKFEALLAQVQREAALLKDEKASTERELEQLNMPLLITAECLSNRDSRLSTELTYDMADTELKKELCATESNKKELIQRIESALVKINKLENIKLDLMLEINNKLEVINIDKSLLMLDNDCANITLKLDPMRVPKRAYTAEEWSAGCEHAFETAEKELQNTLALREALSVARARARNTRAAQADATNHALRRRVYETQRARNELQWQTLKMEENMEKLTDDLVSIERALLEKTNAQKLAETRLETRNYRPGMELCLDEADEGLKEEVSNIRKTIQQLKDKLDCARTTYNALADHASLISIDLADKEHTLETDIRALEMRSALTAKGEPSKNKILLRSIQDELPPQ